MRNLIAALLLVFVFLAVGCLAYLGLLPPCSETPYRGPAAPPIRSVGPFYVVTDQGRLWPGQTYEYQSEGVWIGNHTLVIAFGGHAAWITRYSAHHPSNHRPACRIVHP
jgi:hypothetical protein